jgi:hypothetical protein
MKYSLSANSNPNQEIFFLSHYLFWLSDFRNFSQRLKPHGWPITDVLIRCRRNQSQCVWMGYANISLSYKHYFQTCSLLMSDFMFDQRKVWWRQPMEVSQDRSSILSQVLDHWRTFQWKHDEIISMPWPGIPIGTSLTVSDNVFQAPLVIAANEDIHKCANTKLWVMVMGQPRACSLSSDFIRLLTKLLEIQTFMGSWRDWIPKVVVYRRLIVIYWSDLFIDGIQNRVLTLWTWSNTGSTCFQLPIITGLHHRNSRSKHYSNSTVTWPSMITSMASSVIWPVGGSFATWQPAPAEGWSALWNRLAVGTVITG